jgi:hypothetical protein
MKPDSRSNLLSPPCDTSERLSSSLKMQRFISHCRVREGTNLRPHINIFSDFYLRVNCYSTITHSWHMSVLLIFSPKCTAMETQCVLPPNPNLLLSGLSTVGREHGGHRGAAPPSAGLLPQQVPAPQGRIPFAEGSYQRGHLAQKSHQSWHQGLQRRGPRPTKPNGMAHPRGDSTFPAASPSHHIGT